MDQSNKSIERFKDQQKQSIDVMKERLSDWIKQQTGATPADSDPRERDFLGPYTEINAALLDTAIDRMLALLGGADTREFLLKAFDRRAAAYKKSLV